MKILKVVLVMLLVFSNLFLIGENYYTNQKIDLMLETDIVFVDAIKGLREIDDSILEVNNNFLIGLEELHKTDESIVDGFGELVIDYVETRSQHRQVKQVVKKDRLKPDYKYLKSVTVFLKGVIEERDETGAVMGIGGFTGTGTVVDIDEEYTYILSNNHVLNDSYNTRLFVEEDGVDYEIEVIARHPTLDLALGRVEGTIANKVKVRGFSSSKPQDKVFLVGNPIGRKFNYGEGVFAGYDREFSIVQIPVMPGNSGSGVFDQQGNLVGVVFALSGASMPYGVAYDVAHGIIVDGQDVMEFLSKDVIKFLGKYL